MWFKNLKIYRFKKPLGLLGDDIESLLAANEFKPCGKTDRSSTGWVTPAGKESKLFAHTVGNATMICLTEQSKILPASVVNEALLEQAGIIQEREGRKLYRKERDQLKDEIIMDMLPQAFCKTKSVYAFFTTEYLVVNTASSNTAEQLLHLLRTTLDSLPVVPLLTKQFPGDVFTSWIEQGHATNSFELAEELECYSPKDQANKVRFTEQDLCSDEVAQHLQYGKRVKQLGVTWTGGASMVINDGLTIKKLKFSDFVIEKANDDAESALQQFDQDFAVLSVTVLSLIDDLVKALGGIHE